MRLRLLFSSGSFQSSYIDWLVLILMNGCFATALPFIKQSLVSLHPCMSVAIRMLLAGVVLCGYQCVVDITEFKRPLNIRLLVWTAFITIYMLCMGEAWALQYVPVTKASLLWALLPLMTALCAHLGMYEPLSTSAWRAIGLGMVGMFLLVFSQGGVMTAWTQYDIADLVMLGAVAAAAYGYFLLRQLMSEGHNIIVANGLMMLIGGGMSLLTVMGMQGVSSCESIVWWPALGYIGCVVVIVNIVGLSLQLWLLQRQQSVTLLALSSFLTPLYGVVAGVMVLREPLDGWYIFAALCIGWGLYLLYNDQTMRVHSGTN